MSRKRPPTKRLWFAAHVLMVVKTKKRRQTRFPVFENILLVSAATAPEALETAKRFAQREAGVGGEVLLEGVPAQLTFGGIRKVVSCSATFEGSEDGYVHKVHNGMEASYLRFSVRGTAALERLIAGKSVTVTYEE